MKPTKALNYLEQVVEFARDMDPTIGDAIAVLARTIEEHATTTWLLEQLLKMPKVYVRVGREEFVCLPQGEFSDWYVKARLQLEGG